MCRNHLGIMTRIPMALGTQGTTVDLASNDQLSYGIQATTTVGAVQALWAGHVTFDGTIKYTGQDNDRDPILQNIGGVVPTNIRVEQVP